MNRVIFLIGCILFSWGLFGLIQQYFGLWGSITYGGPLIVLYAGVVYFQRVQAQRQENLRKMKGQISNG